MSYEDRLKELKLPTLSYRRIRGDMIECYKLLHKHYYFNEQDILKLNTNSRTRGNSLKLQKFRSRLDIRKYAFSNRVVDIWNSLPDCVVTAKSLHAFENRLDKYWSNQELVYDFAAKVNVISGHQPENEELVSEAANLLPESV